MYTKPVGEIIKRYNIKYHCYAEDTQVYIILKPCDKLGDISSSIEARIADITSWMNSNMLKLNKDKTGFIVFIQATCKKVRIQLYKFGHVYKKSRVILDNTLGIVKQVNYICKSCYYQIRNIGLIRKYINDETPKI